MISLATNNPELFKRLEDCKCGSKEKAIFYCKEKSCQNLRFTFCESCEEHHEHRCIRLDRYVIAEDIAWKKDLSGLDTLVEEAKVNIEKYNELIDLFDGIAEENKN